MHGLDRVALTLVVALGACGGVSQNDPVAPTHVAPSDPAEVAARERYDRASATAEVFLALEGLHVERTATMRELVRSMTAEIARVSALAREAIDGLEPVVEGGRQPWAARALLQQASIYGHLAELVAATPRPLPRDLESRIALLESPAAERPAEDAATTARIDPAAAEQASQLLIGAIDADGARALAAELERRSDRDRGDESPADRVRREVDDMIRRTIEDQIAPLRCEGVVRLQRLSATTDPAARDEVGSARHRLDAIPPEVRASCGD